MNNISVSWNMYCLEVQVPSELMFAWIIDWVTVCVTTKFFKQKLPSSLKDVYWTLCVEIKKKNSVDEKL